jgi:hypothetical protein
MSDRVIFVDGASGTKGGDSFALADAVQSGGLTLLKAVRVWHPPFSPTVVIDEVVAYIRAQRERELVGDNWSGQLLREMIQQASRGELTYRVCEWTKAELYLRFLPMVNAGRVRLLDHPELLRQLRGLERRRGWGGKDRVDHRRGQHDDLANACAGACVLAAEGAGVPPLKFWTLRSAGELDAADEQAEREAAHQDLRERVMRGGGVFMPGIDG